MRKNAHTYVIEDTNGETALDLGADFDGKPVNVKYMDNLGLDISWSGSSPVGQLFVEVSNNPAAQADELSASDWRELDFGTNIAISGNSDNGLININQVPFNWFRVRYARTSGTGTMTVILTMKQAA